MFFGGVFCYHYLTDKAKTLIYMKLSAWMREASQDARQQVAEKAGTSVAYLWQLAGFHRTPSAALAAKIETATKGKVTRLELLYQEEASD